MILEIFCIACLCLPLLWELWDDRNGEKHPNNDWALRALFMVLGSGLASLFSHKHNMIQNLLLSLGIFVFFFPYLMNIVHLKRKVTTDKKWWDHLSKDAWPDNQDWWNGIPWFARLVLVGIVFAATLMVYNCWKCLFIYQ